MQNTLDRADANGYEPASPCDRFPGLTKREHFAAQMLAAMLVDPQGVPGDILAKEAVRAADALLIELEKREVPS